MTVQAISGLMKTPTSLYTDKTPGSMDKTDFLNLLITQIQQQDPLNPQDPSEFTAQLTQFSSLEQMMNMNTSIQNLQALQLSSNNTMAASLIGKDVIYSGDTMTIAGGKANDIRFDSPSAANNVVVTITDSSNKVVRTINMDSAVAGMNKIPWDGLDSNGVQLADGQYKVSVAAKDATTGDAVTVTPMATGLASGLIFKDGITYLDIEGHEVALSDIYSVYQAAA